MTEELRKCPFCRNKQIKRIGSEKNYNYSCDNCGWSKVVHNGIYYDTLHENMPTSMWLNKARIKDDLKRMRFI